MPAVPASVKVLGLLIGLLVAGIVVSLISNVVVWPLWNKRWLSQNATRCSASTSTRRFGVVLICNGVLGDTQRQIQDVIKQAHCAHRVFVVVVRFGHTVAELGGAPNSLDEALARSHAFRGIQEQFPVEDHVHVVQGGGQPLGTPVAIALALPRLQVQGATHMVVMGPQAEVVPAWDKVLDEQFDTPTVAGLSHSVLSYGITSDNMPQPTFAVLSVQDGVPVLAWQPFQDAPLVPHPSLLMSTDFFALPVASLHPSLVDKLRQMPCPPGFGDVYLSYLMRKAGMVLMAPNKLVVNGRVSRNTTQFHAALRSSAIAHSLNARTTATLLAFLQQYSASVARFMGVDVANNRATKEAKLGLHPSGAGASAAQFDEDVRVKYTSTDALERVWKKIAPFA